MPIDFHDPANRLTYAGRRADETWRSEMRDIVDPAGLHVVDIGCGGGTYSRAWLELGAAQVTGVDFSAEMLATARADSPGEITFTQGDAAATGLPDASADVVFERALVHHVADLGAVAAEARRLLRPGGTYIVQDRTVDDASEPGGPEHVRGLIFDRFPRLLDVERARRPDREALAADLRAAGFATVETRHLWETNQVHASLETLTADLRARRGRSILHDLDDAEIDALADHVATRLPPDAPIVERDPWTLWIAR
jgi:ubiquinone/menaquinone biosynthesis C-methylase UbiE